MFGIVAGAITALSALVGAGTAIYSAIQQREAAEEAEEIAERNAQRAEMETEREAQRLRKQQQQELALNRARAYASGIDPETGSVQLYLQEMRDTQREDLEWLRRTGATRAESFIEQGKFARYSAEAASMQSIGRAFGYTPQLFSGVRTAGKGIDPTGTWWR